MQCVERNSVVTYRHEETYDTALDVSLDRIELPVVKNDWREKPM